MIKILFLRSDKAFLPEIDAYISYFNKTKDFKAYDSSKIKRYEIKDFDVIWEVKGFGGVKVKDQILVHEYASLSTGNFPRFKNMLKSKLNRKPDLRIFLNENVKEEFGFDDDVDYCFRDMGIDERFLQVRDAPKEYDFVYVGSVCKDREIDKLLQSFTNKNNGSLCLIGNVEDDIYNTYKNNKDIIFTGKVPYEEVPKIASKAVYGINYMPDKYPFNIQTSTKLLEYLSMDLKVVTTDYKWVRQFETKHGCSFYKFGAGRMVFDKGGISEHEFVNEFRYEDYLWERVIEGSKIKKSLLSLSKRK